MIHLQCGDAYTPGYKRHDTVGHARRQTNVTKRTPPNEGHEKNCNAEQALVGVFMEPFSNNGHSNVKEQNSGHFGCNLETNTVTTRGS